MLSPTRLLGELRAIAMARATDYLTVRDGALEIRSTQELTPEQCAAIASVERSTGGLKVKFYDKLKALELLGKYMGLFENRAAWQTEQENNLLEVLLQGTAQEVDTHDIPEIQQTAAAGDDMVEPARPPGE